MNEVPLSLYLRLEQGEHANLTTVSRAALAFAEVIQELASDLFPDAEIRIEAVDATEASFGWNTLTKVYLDAKAGILAGARKYPKVAYLAAYVALRILNNGVDWTQDQVMDWLAGKDAPAEVRALSKRDRQELAEDIVARLRRGVAQKPADTIYQEVRKDNSVEGVGVTVRAGERPERIVPRDQFTSDRLDDDIDGEHRVYSRVIQATLISPVLAPGDRRWKFRTATGEFGAPVRDQDFLEDVLSGRADLRLRAGLVLDLELEVTEVFTSGAWNITQRVVTKVYGWHNLPEQGDLLAPLSDNVQEAQQSEKQSDGGQ